MASYVPPPPIAASMVNLPVRSVAPVAHEPETILALHRREAQLQADLQHLLDAQAEGLTAGLTGGVPESIPEDLTSNGSSTPIASLSFRPSSYGRSMTVAESRRPEPPKLGLGGARRGLWRTIRKLAAVKDEEVTLIGRDIEDNGEVLGRIDTWEQKRDGLQASIRNIEQDSEEGSRAKNLRKEAQELGVEIQEIEARLAEMKSRHRMMIHEVGRLENAVQAQMSSYRESLGIVEKEIRGFLEQPPSGATDMGLPRGGRKGKGRVDDFTTLPPRRRNLELAKTHWEERRRDLDRRREGVEFEKEALEEGAVVWKDVVDEVMDFEGKLRNHMRSMRGEHLQSEKGEEGQALKTLLKSMDQTAVQVESKFKLAEARDWKLLVCCIGAELEAFKQGREILEDALVDGEGKDEQSPIRSSHDDLRELNGGLLGQDPAAMTGSRESVIRLNKTKKKDYDTEDDEPDPELLISHQDTDASE
ncbi:MAG: hypothetical protein M1820_005857 [Bogoriella megaspora]|nr:MAG: hypothetical protein M1820_005857 [Bogoriella megaspora]